MKDKLLKRYSDESNNPQKQISLQFTYEELNIILECFRKSEERLLELGELYRVTFSSKFDGLMNDIENVTIAGNAMRRRRRESLRRMIESETE